MTNRREIDNYNTLVRTMAASQQRTEFQVRADQARDAVTRPAPGDTRPMPYQEAHVYAFGWLSASVIRHSFRSQLLADAIGLQQGLARLLQEAKARDL